MKMNKLLMILVLIILLLVIVGAIDIYQKTHGKDTPKADYCRSLGYEVINEFEPIFEMRCFKSNEGVRNYYRVSEDNKGNYYLKEIVSSS